MVSENDMIGREIPLPFADPWVRVEPTLLLTYEADQAIQDMFQQVRAGDVEAREMRAWIHAIANGAFQAGRKCRIERGE